MGSIFRNEYIVKQLPSSIIISFLNFSHKMLMKQKKVESLSLKKKLKRDIDCNFVSDDENNNSDSGDDNPDDMPISQLYLFY
jgi:hypothetical protein